jgi:hypothetical protein
MNMIKMRSGLIFMAFIVPAIVRPMAQSANFSGTWKLNIQKGFLGNEHRTDDYQLTKTIEQKGDQIKQTDVALHVSIMNIPLPDSTTTLELAIDGKEHDMRGAAFFPGIPTPFIKVSAVWQGNTLSIREISQPADAASETYRRFFLSDDGSELNELIEGHTGFGDTEQHLVFERQNQ